MTQYTSQLYRCEYGPGLLLLINVERSNIVHTDLDEVKSEGMHWQIVFDEENPKLEKKICAWLETYCHRQQPQEKLPFELGKFPSFTQQVLEKLLHIPFGQTLNYQQLAAQVGRPSGARAAGNACGRNPVPLFVPCHRILASGNRLGGFSMGLSIKQRLLQFEGIPSKN